MAISTYKRTVPTQSAVRVAGGNAGVAVGNFYIKENGAGSVKSPETAVGVAGGNASVAGGNFYIQQNGASSVGSPETVVGVAGDNADVAGCNFYIQENGAGSVKQGPHFSVRKIPIGWYACPQPPQVRKIHEYFEHFTAALFTPTFKTTDKWKTDLLTPINKLYSYSNNNRTKHATYDLRTSTSTKQT